MQSSSSSARRGGASTFLGQSFNLLLQLVGMVILARLVSPDDFGILAMAAVFLALAQMLRDAGLVTASLQAKTLTSEQSSNLFWVSLLVGSLVGCLYFASIPFLIWLYDEPRVADIVPILTFVIIISAAQSQVQVVLARRYRFRTLIWTSIVANTVSIFCSVVLAVFGLGYWALAYQVLVHALLLLGLRWLMARFPIRRIRRGVGTMALVRSSARLGVAQFFDWFSQNVGQVILGATVSAASVGYFDRAFQFSVSPLSYFVGPLTQVVVPASRRAEGRGVTFKTSLFRVQAVTSFMVLWILGVGVILSPAFVTLILGVNWEPLTPVLQLMLLGSALMLLSWPTYWLFLFEEASSEQMRYAILTRTLMIGVVVFGAFGAGVAGAAGGFVIGRFCIWVIGLCWGKFRLRSDASGLSLRSGYFALVFIVSIALAYLIAGTLENLDSVASGVVLTAIFSFVYFATHLTAPFGRFAVRELSHFLR